MPDESDPSGELNRRRLLGMLGSGTAGMVFSTGLTGARPGRGHRRGNGHGGPPNRTGRQRGVGPCTCPDSCPDGTFCGKVEGAPEEGRTYTFSSDGDSYSVTIDDVTTKDDGEITCFTFSTTDDIREVCVKGGPDTITYDDSPEDTRLCAPTNPGGQQSEISNFSFCGSECVCYQVDLVWWQESYPIKELSSPDNLYGDDNLIESYHDDTCNDSGPAMFSYDNPDVERDGCEISNIQWEVVDNSISARFDLGCEVDAEVRIGLVSYEAPCLYREPKYDGLTDMPVTEQEFVDASKGTFRDNADLQVQLPL